LEDAEDLLEIYRPHVVTSAVSFEWAMPSLEEFRLRISDVLQDFPWIVVEDESGILGYAYAARYRNRMAYQWSVETSVYVRDGYHRKGVATTLYKELLAILKEQYYTTAFAVITLPNEKSVGFHESHGFKYLCTFPKVGFKLGSWHDVGWWAKELNPQDCPPKTPVRFKEIFSRS
jgi:L-amino acid N-acyltransferase YncA